MTEFAKYHKIEAIEKADIPATVRLTLQEKLDGANAGIERQGFDLIVHSRNNALARINRDGVVTPLKEFGSFGLLVAQVASVASELIYAMGELHITHIYGEWLVPHTIRNYPEEMWRKFYVYDVLVEDSKSEQQVFTEPRTAKFFPEDYGFCSVETGSYLGRHGTEPITKEEIGQLAQNFKTRLNRPVEGFVIKDYYADAQGKTDRFGNRLCWKYIFPEFKESNKLPRGPLPETDVEQALVDALPERTIAKRYADVVAANDGKFEGRLIPQIIGRVWNDYVTEFLDGALKSLKYPTVDTKLVKQQIEARARAFALSQKDDFVYE